LTVRGRVFALTVDALTATRPMTNTTTAIDRVVRNDTAPPLDARNGDANTRVARAAALPRTTPSRK
jgi:hypothetical protein